MLKNLRELLTAYSSRKMLIYTPRVHLYPELLRRVDSVYVGHLADDEVDFVVQNSDGVYYYQCPRVSLATLNENAFIDYMSNL